jgi:hypothetical protein
MKLNYKLFLITGIAWFMMCHFAFTQGCIAIHSTGSSGMLSPSTDSVASGWLLSSAVRYFKSFRHFSGTEEEKERIKNGTQVINYQFSMDISVTRILNNRWSLLVNLPILSNTRSSLYEHGLVNGVNPYNERHSMHSFGIGDMRIAAYYWLLNAEKHFRGNVQIGVGIKFPTGDYQYEDYWHHVGANGSDELRPVDQSIQLGDGGTGFSVEANGFYRFNRHVNVYGNVYYLINPREQNGVRTYRETLSPIFVNEAIMSVPDQYAIRAGANYTFLKLHLLAGIGARLEGIPVHDFIGGSQGFRRPGYIWSAEPSLQYHFKKTSLQASVPIAIVRNRTQSVTDKENSILYHKHIQGDAAFADYVINVSLAYRL